MILRYFKKDKRVSTNYDSYILIRDKYQHTQYKLKSSVTIIFIISY